jgi:hypothetical protein
MKKTFKIVAVILAIGSLTSCYDFNRQQERLDRENDGKGILMKARYEKQARIEEAKANYESAKLEAQTKQIRAEANSKAKAIEALAKAKAIKFVSDAIQNNPDYIKYIMVDGMYNHGKTIYIPTEAGLPIIERK